ncbi:MAG: imidazolonepropionase [Candidatus Lokiarchaeota archaeon]|nr:imidazolonepropionase [Candidatus Lokiarchaeota archaeon]
MSVRSTPSPKRIKRKGPNNSDQTPKVDLIIIHANELVTMDSTYGVPRTGLDMKNLAIIQDGAIAISRNSIIFVGTTQELIANFPPSQETIIIDATNRLVTPGFIDPHTHIIFDGTRENELEMKLAGKSYLEILESGGGIIKTVKATREAPLAQLIKNGKLILDRMMEYGTTTIETKSGYGLDTENEIKSLLAAKELDLEHPIDIISTFLGAHAVPPEYDGKTDEYVEVIISEMIPRIAKEELAEFCDVFCEEGIFSIDQTKKILLTAIKYGMKPQIHIDEIVDTNGAFLASELKAVQVGHMLKSNDNGLEALKKTKIIATLLPGTPFCLMMNEYAPARKIIDMGIPIALATDLNPNCWTESMQMIIALACYHMKLSPAEALTAATINAACAIERQEEIGSLEVGKKADIIVFGVPNHSFLPYQFGVNLVSKVIKNGKVVVDFD